VRVERKRTMQTDVIEARRATGKWKEAGVPRKGWTYIGDPEYVGPDSETCEMCKVTEIRWVHRVRHAKYSTVLRVGCVCAGNLTRAYEQPDPEPGVLDASMLEARKRQESAIKAKERSEKAAAKEKERALQALVDQAVADSKLEKRRDAWPSRVWPLSGPGNETILEDGFKLTVFKKRNGWSGSWWAPGAKEVKYLRDIHDTCESAKLALFDNMIFLQKKKVK
jgi:hypothetical protein